MTPQVSLQGVTPYEVEDQWMVEAGDSEALSGSIPSRWTRDVPQSDSDVRRMSERFADPVS